MPLLYDDPLAIRRNGSTQLLPPRLLPLVVLLSELALSFLLLLLLLLVELAPVPARVSE